MGDGEMRWPHSLDHVVYLQSTQVVPSPSIGQFTATNNSSSRRVPQKSPVLTWTYVLTNTYREVKIITLNKGLFFMTMCSWPSCLPSAPLCDSAHLWALHIPCVGNPRTLWFYTFHLCLYLWYTQDPSQCPPSFDPTLPLHHHSC